MNCEYVSGSSNKDRIPEIEKQIKEYKIIIDEIHKLILFYFDLVVKTRKDHESLVSYSDISLNAIKRELAQSSLDELKRLRLVYCDRLQTEENYLENAIKPISSAF